MFAFGQGINVETQGNSYQTLSRLSQMVPREKKTGNVMTDRNNDALRGAFQELIEACLKNKRIITPLYGEMKNLTRIAPETYRGEKVVQAVTLKQLDPSFLASWIVSASDMDEGDLIRLNKEDKDNCLILVQLGTQLSSSIRLDVFAEPLIEPVLIKVLDSLHTANGRPLVTYTKTAPKLERNLQAKLDMGLKGRFYFQFKKGHATHVVNRGDKKVAIIPLHTVILGSHVIKGNELDTTASVHLPPTPPIPLKSYFQPSVWGKDGYPLKAERYGGQSKAWKDFVNGVAVEHQTGARAGSSSSDVGVRCKQEFAEEEKSQKRQRMVAAQVKAKEQLARKRSRKEVQVNPSGADTDL
jgi:hypothetical protein